MKIWQFIKDKLGHGQNVILLYVLDSQGSSPGRQGFKMVIAENGEIKGTIGGGIMEHKLVEQSRNRLQKGEKAILLKPQFHDKEHTKNQSGMICSGHQYVASIPIQAADQTKVEKLLSIFEAKAEGFLFFDTKGWKLLNTANLSKKESRFFDYKNETAWSYTEQIIQSPMIHIFGGGHVGLALSEVMSLLGFYIKVYDDRSELNTLEQNRFAQEKQLLDYQNIAESFQAKETDYVAIMTFGYRTDKLILKQLIHKNFAYLGMMGSKAKIAQLLKELTKEGFSKEKLANLKAPIGFNISSKTTMEIAISIAAEIIKEKNRLAALTSDKLSKEKTNTQKNYEKRG